MRYDTDKEAGVLRVLGVGLFLAILANAVATDCVRSQPGHWPVLSSIERNYLSSNMRLDVAPPTAVAYDRSIAEIRSLVIMRRELEQAGANYGAVLIAAISMISGMVLTVAFGCRFWWLG